MKTLKVRTTTGILLAASWLVGCAGMQDLITAPVVELKRVELTEIDLTRQTFLLGFDIANPNPFPLPVQNIRYGVALDGYEFASGETAGAFTVPADGDSEFAITVELNLMQTAPALLWIVRDAARREIPYQLDGELGVDLPFAKPLPFRQSGNIRLLTAQR